MQVYGTRFVGYRRPILLPKQANHNTSRHWKTFPWISAEADAGLMTHGTKRAYWKENGSKNISSDCNLSAIILAFHLNSSFLILPLSSEDQCKASINRKLISSCVLQITLLSKLVWCFNLHFTSGCKFWVIIIQFSPGFQLPFSVFLPGCVITTELYHPNKVVKPSRHLPVTKQCAVTLIPHTFHFHTTFFPSSQ